MVVRKMLAGMGTATAAVILGITGVPAAAQPLPNAVDHWGSYTGNLGTAQVPTGISLPGQVAEAGTSNSTQYALLTNGSLYAWGEGTQGQLGNGQETNSFTTAVQVSFPPGVRIAWIPTDTMPYDSALAVDTNGNAWGWGRNDRGELCLGNNHAHSTPVELPFTNVTALAGGGSHAVYDANGTLYSCGSGQAGELGDGSTSNSNVPARVRGLNGRLVTTLVAAYANGGALLNNGQYYDWGNDSKGQLGIGTIRQNSAVPVKVRLPGSVAQVAQGGSLAGNGQTLVMLSDGSLWAWGDNQYHQLGNGGSGVASSPVPFSAPSGVTYRMLATAANTSYAVSSTGQVYAWGQNNEGQVGDGSGGTAIQPVVVDSWATSISATANDVAAAFVFGG
jgi:alpha-tubulin suppressor-like RCC1 family protein